jgi:hypothetical protein
MTREVMFNHEACDIELCAERLIINFKQLSGSIGISNGGLHRGLFYVRHAGGLCRISSRIIGAGVRPQLVLFGASQGRVLILFIGS